MFCKNCGNQLQENEITCPGCGASVRMRRDGGDEIPSFHAGSAVPPNVPKEWFITINGEQKGPFSTIEMMDMLKNGAIEKQSYVWKRGMANWDVLENTELVKKSNRAYNFDHDFLSKRVNFFNHEYAMDELLGWACSIVIIISCYMPYYSVSALGYSESITYISGGRDGMFVLPLVIVASSLLYYKKATAALVLNVIAYIIIWIDFFDAMSRDIIIGNMGIGAYFLLISGMVSCWMARSARLRLKREKANG